MLPRGKKKDIQIERGGEVEEEEFIYMGQGDGLEHARW